MRRTVSFLASISAAAIACGMTFPQAARQNQPPRPAVSPSAEILRLWLGTHNKLIEMAKDFPEDKYNFKVQKDQRTFAENLLHVAGTDYEFLSAVAGRKMGPELKDQENPSRDVYKTKADVVKLLQQASDDGAALLKEQGDAGLSKEIKAPFGNSMWHVAYAWEDDIEHDGEHYGQLVVYYRANNMVPPESRPRPGNN